METETREQMLKRLCEVCGVKYVSPGMDVLAKERIAKREEAAKAEAARLQAIADAEAAEAAKLAEAEKNAVAEV